MTLTKFVSDYTMKLEKIWEKEDNDDCDCAIGKQNLLLGIVWSWNRLPKHIQLLSLKCFKMSIYMHILMDFIHVLSTNEKRTEHIVTFSIDDTAITCSCKLFWSKNIIVYTFITHLGY